MMAYKGGENSKEWPGPHKRHVTFSGATCKSLRALIKKEGEGLPITIAERPVAYCNERKSDDLMLYA